MKVTSLSEAATSVAQTKDAVDPVDGIDLRNLFTKATLGDLMRCPDVEVSTKHNNIEATVKQPDGILNVSMRRYDKVSGATLYFAKRVKPLYRQMPDIIKLRGEGKTQQQVAKILGMSQGYVSVLERKYKQQDNIA